MVIIVAGLGPGATLPQLSVAKIAGEGYYRLIDVLKNEPERCQSVCTRGMNMPPLEKVLRNQPYPCFRLVSVPAALDSRLKKGMLCLYNIDEKTFEFPVFGRIGPAEELLASLDFVGYYALEEFRDLVFAGRLPVTCPSCKGPAEDAGMISFELEETGTAQLAFASGDAEMYACEFCGRPFALMPAADVHEGKKP